MQCLVVVLLAVAVATAKDGVLNPVAKATQQHMLNTQLATSGILNTAANNVWTQPKLLQVDPGPLCFHVFAHLPKLEWLLIFGGINSIPLFQTFPQPSYTQRLFAMHDGLSAMTWIYQLPTAQWANLTYLLPSDGPPARAGAVSGTVELAVYGGVVMFGGLGTNGTMLDDVWLFVGANAAWFPVTTTVEGGGAGPEARWGASAVTEANTLYVIGGSIGQQGNALADMSELWELQLHTPLTNDAPIEATWRKHVTQGIVPPRRVFFFFAELQGTLLVAGGWNPEYPEAAPYNHTYMLDWGKGSIEWVIREDTGLPYAGGSITKIGSQQNTSYLLAIFGNRFGYNFGVRTNAFTVSSWEAHILKSVDGVWERVSFATGIQDQGPNVPSGCIGAGFVAVGGLAFKSGGFDTYVGAPVGDLIAATLQQDIGDTGALLWVPTVRAVQPPPTMLACSTTVDDFFYVIGGWSRTFEELAHVWAFEFKLQTWVRFQTTIPGRAGATATAINSTIYVMFGAFQTESGSPVFLNDVWTMDTGDLIGKQIIPKSTNNPAPRQGHSAAVVDGTRIIVYGGFNCNPNTESCVGFYTAVGIKEFDDVWMFDTTTEIWSELPQHGQGPGPGSRAFHTAAYLTLPTPGMYIFGGINTSAAHDVFRYDITSHIWTRIAAKSPSPTIESFSCGGKFAPHDTPSSKLYYTVSVAVSETERGGIQNVWIYNAVIDQWEQLSLEAPAIQPLLAAQSCSLSSDATQLFVFGGQNLFGSEYSDQLLVVKPTCSSGQAGPVPLYKPGQCSTCPIGTYAEAGAATCASCPPGTLTALTGSVSQESCSRCDAGTSCNHHGSCTVRGTSVICHCDFGHTGVRCELPLFGIVVGAIIGVVAFVAFVIFLVKRFRKRLVQFKAHSDLQEQLLTATKIELQDLESVWLIAESDIQLQRKIGVGTSGEVFLAKYFQSDVAVKVLHQQLVELDNSSLEEFEQEAKFLRTLRHRNIVYFHGFGLRSADTPFLVIEYCARGCLRSVLDDPDIPFGWLRQRNATLDAVKGMSYLHTKRRAHRDLKSANLLVTSAFVTKVGDFGHSRDFRNRTLSSAGTQETLAGTVEATGTLLWNAPEQWDPACHVDAFSADVFSFAVCMFEIGSRRLPYEEQNSKSLIELQDAITAGLRPDVKQLRAIPQGFIEVMERAWSDIAKERPSFAELETLIQQLPA
eukprot:m.45689 g.45689  ORF g.45689 m.45689 type:complete len:1198 (+) comp11799_c0_seq1:102-3695(+)